MTTKIGGNGPTISSNVTWSCIVLMVLRQEKQTTPKTNTLIVDLNSDSFAPQAIGLSIGPHWASHSDNVVIMDDRPHFTWKLEFFLLPLVLLFLAFLRHHHINIVMDLSTVTAALASKSYDRVADVCDNLMLQVAADGIAYQDDWPYAIHILAHIYVHDMLSYLLSRYCSNSARFLWKSIPSSIKESQPEVTAVWKISQRLWLRDYAGVHEAIRGFDWSQDLQGLVAAFSELYTKKMFQLLLSAYSTISIQDTALFLGMNEDDATNYVLQQGWTVDPASQMLTVKNQSIVTEQKLDPSKLQRLTEYVFHLEH